MPAKPSWKSFLELPSADGDFLGNRPPIITEGEEDRELLEDVVRYHQPSMRIISNGFGDSCLTMSPEDGRRTARTKPETKGSD